MYKIVVTFLNQSIYTKLRFKSKRGKRQLTLNVAKNLASLFDFFEKNKITFLAFKYNL
jgi:hypothetical protein